MQWIVPAYLQSREEKGHQSRKHMHWVWVSTAISKRLQRVQFGIFQAAVQQMWKLVEEKLKKKMLECQNCQWCLMFWIDFLKLTFNKWSWNGNGCMGLSPHSKVSSLLPGLGHWVPGEDRGEKVVMTPFIITTGDEEDLVDHRSSKSGPFWRKLSALHLPPLQLAVSWNNGHLVVIANMKLGFERTDN